MKLRNKQHRDIIADLQNNWCLMETGDKIILKNQAGVGRFEFTSLEALAKEWETIKEPLLKGDLRFAVKVWLDYCDAKPDDNVIYDVCGIHSRLILHTKNRNGGIDSYWFEMSFKLSRVKEGKIYSISDLLGEE